MTITFENHPEQTGDIAVVFDHQETGHTPCLGTLEGLG
jgi:hypothetical protein